MAHSTDLSHAWSLQVPQDVPPTPGVVSGGVHIAYRERFGSAVVRNLIDHQQPIQQKRDKDDMELLRKILTGIAKRPDHMKPNADHAAQLRAMTR